MEINLWVWISLLGSFDAMCRAHASQTLQSFFWPFFGGERYKLSNLERRMIKHSWRVAFYLSAWSFSFSITCKSFHRLIKAKLLSSQVHNNENFQQAWTPIGAFNLSERLSILWGKKKGIIFLKRYLLGVFDKLIS